ncbi:MAG: hypothetical protein KJ880_08360 [Candidatus Omnitrophica bacterium]|nr:hypothetical protein [Candidatus Omnitrophota bacterium]MBU1869693.1 hypothetical protein [Candidatus Omnitrophota bacterium]
MRKTHLYLVCLFIIAGLGLCFAQESEDMNVMNEDIMAPMAQVEPQWQYFEVVSVDPANKSIVVKYLDYDTDQQKQMMIAVDEKTTYENAASLNEIKPEASIGVDYVVDSTGKNIATNISLEKFSPQGGIVEQVEEDMGEAPQNMTESEEEASVEDSEEELPETQEPAF